MSEPIGVFFSSTEAGHGLLERGLEDLPLPSQSQNSDWSTAQNEALRREAQADPR